MKLVFRALAIWVGFLLIAGLLGLQGVSAQNEYTNGTIAFRYCDVVDWFVGCFDISLTYDPKVVCSPDNSECVLLVYEDRAGSESIRVKYSTGVAGRHYENLVYGCPPTGLFPFGAWWDAFYGGCAEVGYVSFDFGASGNNVLRGYEDNYHLSYDVTYYNGEFYFFVDDYMYKTDGSSITNLGRTPFSVGHDYRFTDEYASGLGFCEEGDETFFVGVEGACYSATYNVYFNGDVTKLKGTMLDCDKAYVKASVPACGAQPFWLTKFYMNGSAHSHVVFGTMPSFGGGFVGISSFPSNFTGIDYYLKDLGFVIYQRDHNSSWITYTDDYLTYTGTAEYYAWDVGNNETINISDAFLNNRNKIAGFEYFHSDTTIDGVYVYNEPQYAFQVKARGLNLDTLAIESLNVTAGVFKGNYSYATTGVDPILMSPYQNNNSIVIDVAGWQPSIVLLTGIDSLDPSGITYITSPSNGLGWVNPYNVSVGVFDTFTSDSVSGASVTIDGDNHVTDADGYAIFTLVPYSSANFYVYNQSLKYYLSLFGTPETYEATITAGGYISSDSEEFTLVESGSPSSGGSFDRMKNFQIDPIYARLVIDVFWKDGVHYEGDTAVVNVGGADTAIYLESGGVFVDRNYATEFPATFIMLDTRSSWTANFNITSDGYFDSDTESIVNTTYYYFPPPFFLPNASTSHECNTDLGCVSFCKGNIFYSNGRCESGVCIYDIESCVLCDDDAGCYTSTTTETCPSGLDVECYGDNYCLDSKYLASFKCSSAKLCYMDTVECDYLCDEDEGVCIPAVTVAVCDQSTVTGMLSCLQAGMISFIGSSYDPVFVLVLVIFISVLLVTLLTLAVKGVLSSLR